MHTRKRNAQQMPIRARREGVVVVGYANADQSGFGSWLVAVAVAVARGSVEGQRPRGRASGRTGGRTGGLASGCEWAEHHRLPLPSISNGFSRITIQRNSAEALLPATAKSQPNYITNPLDDSKLARGGLPCLPSLPGRPSFFSFRAFPFPFSLPFRPSLCFYVFL